MFKAIKEFFTGKPAVVETPVAEVPYKVETPVVSPVTEQASQAVVESIAPVVEAKPVKAKKAPAAKKPRAPKKPKAV